jgi:glutamine amidotransferase
MLIAIVDFGLGNLRSVAGAVERTGHTPLVTSDVADLERADKLILPGVGAFGDGMRNLHALGLVAPLTRLVMDARKPVLGICLGAQLMAVEGNEFGTHRGLGWVDAVVDPLVATGTTLRVPHVGWNGVRQLFADALFEGIPPDALFYFVHSFYMRCAARELVTAECDYGRPFAAVIHRGNIVGTQFHPEKSQIHGLRLLQNFLSSSRRLSE